VGVVGGAASDVYPCECDYYYLLLYRIATRMVSIVHGLILSHTLVWLWDVGIGSGYFMG
jgi:hypothetical protein